MCIVKFTICESFDLADNDYFGMNRPFSMIIEKAMAKQFVFAIQL